MALRFQRGSVEIAYAREGSFGDPVVLVHGGWDDRTTWDRVVPGLSVAFQVLAYDRRGHGESSPASGGPPVQDDATDLAWLLEGTGLYPAHLIAQGYGAAPALRLATERPELVRGIALHEVPFLGLLAETPGGDTGRPGPSPVRLMAELQRAIALGASGDSKAAAQAFLQLVAAPAERWEGLDRRAREALARNAGAWAREMSDPEATRPPGGQLGSISVPLLATSGAESPPWSLEVNERLVAELPNATSVRLGEGGHFVQRTDPDLFVGVIGSFLLERNVPPT